MSQSSALLSINAILLQMRKAATQVGLWAMRERMDMAASEDVMGAEGKPAAAGASYAARVDHDNLNASAGLLAGLQGRLARVVASAASCFRPPAPSAGSGKLKTLENDA